MEVLKKSNFIKKIVSIMLALTLVISGVVIDGKQVLAADSDIVNIPDAEFKAYLNRQLGVSDKTADITQEQMKKITDISMIYSSNGSDITGIEYCTNLTSFYIEECTGITDISELGKLTNLKSVQIVNCDKITDVSELGNLTNLTSLELVYCDGITDVSELGNLTNLTSLNLRDCTGITDISELGKLTNLTELFLYNCEGIADVSELGKLTSLTNLNLSGCTGITDVSELGNLTKLKILDLSGCAEITDVSELGNLTNLTNLDLSGFKGITDISEIGNLTNLTSLDLSDCTGITDISKLGNLTKLTRLYLRSCSKITDVSEIGKLTNLIYLNLNGCSGITDISEIGKLINLKYLDLTHVKITEENSESYISAVSSLVNLESFYKYYSGLKNEHTSMFYNLTKLENLKIDGNYITDYSFISKLPNLSNSSSSDKSIGNSSSYHKLYIPKSTETYAIKNDVKDENGNYVEPNASEFYVYNQETNEIILDITKCNPYMTAIYIEFDFVVSNSQGYDIKISHNKTVIVETYTKLEFSIQPQDTKAFIEGNVTLSSQAIGQGKASYQWYKDGAIIDGATSKDLFLEKIQLEDAGKYKVVATDINGSVESNEITLTVMPYVGLSGELEVNGSTETVDVIKGSTVSLSVSATGGKGDYTYEYYLVHPSTGEWTKVKDFSSDSEFSYKMQSTGKRIFAVKVKDSDGNIVETNQVIVQVHENVTAKLTIDGSAEGLIKTKGDKVTLKVSATGGIGTYTYKVALLNVATGKWSVLNDFSKSTTYTYALNYSGERQFAVTVKDSAGNTVSTNRIAVTVYDKLSGNLSVDGSANDLVKVKGSKITLTAAASGGNGEYTYKFAVLNVATGKWSILKDFSDVATYTYALNYTGKKQFAVTVKDGMGNTVATNRITVDVCQKLSAKLTVDGDTKALTMKKGSKITLTPVVSGGSGKYTYKYAVKNVSNGKWVVLKDFSDTLEYTYTLNTPGKKQFVVTVKDSAGNTVSTNRITVDVYKELSAKLTVDGSTKELTKAKGSQITLTPVVTGGTGGYTYKYAVLNVSTGKWVVLKDFSDAKTYTYALNYKGQKKFVVTVKDSEGNTVSTNRLTVNVK